MHTAVRAYATAGVALVGASVIAVTPIAPPPDIHIANPLAHISVSVELTQLTNPITPYITLVTDTVTSLVALGQRVAQFPILLEVIANPSATVSSFVSGLQGLPAGLQTLFSRTSLNEITSALQTAVMNLVAGLQGLPAALQSSFTELTMGNISGALNDLTSYALTNLLLLPVFPLITAASSVGTAVGTAVGPNIIGNTIGALFSGNSLINLGLALLYPILTTEQAFAANAQALHDAVTTGDFATAANILIALPAVLADAALNGYQGVSGALSTNFGTIANLLNVRDIIAAAIGSALAPPMTTTTTRQSSTPTAPTALPSLAANTVTVTTDPTKQLAPAAKTPAPANTTATTTAPTVKSGPLTKVLTPLNTTATTTAPTKVTPGQVPTLPTANAQTVLKNVQSQTPNQASGGLTNALQHVGSAGPKHH